MQLFETLLLKRNIFLLYSINYRSRRNMSTSNSEMDHDENGLCSNEAEDEFGDFEEASADQSPSDGIFHDSDYDETNEHLDNSDNSIPITSLTSSEFWKTLFEPKSPLIPSPRIASGALNEETDLIDLFNGYVNKPNDDESTSTNSDFQNSYLNIWKRIHRIEDSEALKFCWSKSLIHQKLLDSFPSCSCPRKTGQDESPQQQKSEATASQNHLSLNPSSAVDSAVNSLYVPPADFDWETSGLGIHPLKGNRAISTIQECNFTSTNGTSNSLDRGNGSILELGLHTFDQMQENQASIDRSNTVCSTSHANIYDRNKQFPTNSTNAADTNSNRISKFFKFDRRLLNYAAPGRFTFRK